MEIISSDMRRRLMASFMLEQQELIEEIASGLRFLEKQRGERPAAGQGASTGSERNKQILNDIFRHAHSLKGAAQAVGLTDIANLGRSLEELLFQAKEGRTALTPSLFEKAFATLAATESAVLEIGHLPLSEEADVNEEISSGGSNG